MMIGGSINDDGIAYRIVSDSNIIPATLNQCLDDVKMPLFCSIQDG